MCAAKNADLSAELDALTTCDAYASKVFAQREANGILSVRRERSTWRAWMSPRIGSKPLALVTPEKIEDIRDALDGEVRERLAGRKGIAGKIAMNVWSMLRTVFAESVSSRDRAMRIRKTDPTTGIKAPLRSMSRQKTFIYPNEAEALLSSAAPREWGEVYAIALYTYLRPGELRALTWRDVDLGAGVIHVTKAYDEDKGESRRPKTTCAMRDVPIEPTLAPLLKRMHQAVTDDAALVLPILEAENEDRRAKSIRAHLELAGVTRHQLTEETTTTMGVNFRSCRDSGLTWLALASVPIERIKSRAGHEHIATTLGYVKMAEDLTGKVGAPFPALPLDLGGPPSRAGAVGPSSAQMAAVINEAATNAAERAGFEPADRLPHRVLSKHVP